MGENTKMKLRVREYEQVLWIYLVPESALPCSFERGNALSGSTT
jgi:hypothetical protein